jgi:NADH-quinone oxidoreductase subunit M
MILAWFIIIPIAGGILSWAAERLGSPWPRCVSLAAMVIELVVGIAAWVSFSVVGPGAPEGWLVEMRADWFPAMGVGFHLAMDGISLLLVLLTALLGVMAILGSWTEIKERTGFYYFNLLFALAGIAGVFLAVDLFLFYFFWELMLVPVYFLIALWGHERRRYAAIKFFIFTHAGGILMLTAIVGLVLINGAETGNYSFDYVDLMGTPMAPPVSLLLFLGFSAAFLVKLPAIPFHPWLPDAHTEAPTGASVILAGLLLKTGAYGLIRFAVPLFPDAAARLAPAGMILAVAGIIYGAALAFAQTDLKRLIACTSISHMGFVLLGISAWNSIALQGAVIQIISHGVSTGALFMLAGALQERMHTRELARMGGLWSLAPRMGGIAMFFAMASLGLPGLGGFIGEFLILLGAYGVSVPLAAIAAVGFVAAVAYALRFMWLAFFGDFRGHSVVSDLSAREMAPMVILVVIMVWIGLFPQAIFDATRPGLDNLLTAPSGTQITFRSERAGRAATVAGRPLNTGGDSYDRR